MPSMYFHAQCVAGTSAKSCATTVVDIAVELTLPTELPRVSRTDHVPADAGVVHVVGLPLSDTCCAAGPTSSQEAPSGGCPLVTACSVTTLEAGTLDGTLVLTMRGVGSSTLTTLLMVEQPCALQDCIVTVLAPGVAKVTRGDCAVEVPARAAEPPSTPRATQASTRRKMRGDAGGTTMVDPLGARREIVGAMPR